MFQERTISVLKSDVVTKNVIDENAVHGSAGPDIATAEMAFFFSDDELCSR